jgi:hypothetical protein
MPQVDIVIFYPQVMGFTTLFAAFFVFLLRNSAPLILAVSRSRFHYYLDNVKMKETIYYNLQLKNFENANANEKIFQNFILLNIDVTRNSVINWTTDSSISNIKESQIIEHTQLAKNEQISEMKQLF